MKDIDSARYAHVKNTRHMRLEDSSEESDGSVAKLQWEPAIIFSMESSRNSNDDDDQQESRAETNTSERDVFDSFEADASREAGPRSETQSLEMEIQIDVVDDRYSAPKIKSSIDEIERSETKLTSPSSRESDGKEECTFEQVYKSDDGQEIFTSPLTQKSVIEVKMPELMLPGKLPSQVQNDSVELDDCPDDERASHQNKLHIVELPCDGDQGSESGFLPLSPPKVNLFIGVGSRCEEEHSINMEHPTISTDPTAQSTFAPNSDIVYQDENCREQSPTDDTHQNENITTALLVGDDCGEEEVGTDLSLDADGQNSNTEDRLMECHMHEDDGRLHKMIIHRNAVNMDGPENHFVCSVSSSDRSVKIDEKWEELSRLILGDEVDPSLQLVKSDSSSSEDVDIRWEKLSDQLLNDDSNNVTTDEAELFEASIGEYMFEKTGLTREKDMEVDRNQCIQETEVLSVLSGATNEDDESVGSYLIDDGFGSCEEAPEKIFSSMSHSDYDECVTGPALCDVLSSVSESSEAENGESNLGIFENKIALDSEKVESLKDVLRKLEMSSQEAKQRLAKRTSGSNSETKSAVLEMEERDDTEDQESLSNSSSEKETSKLSDQRQPDSPGLVDESSAVEDEATPWIENQVEESQTDVYLNCASTPSLELELVKMPQEASPSWRMNPAESHSNWTIEIEHTRSETVDTYHVHKHVLAFGPRRSKFLAEAFRTSSTPSGSCFTRFLMEDAAATMFPLLLDFIYSPAIDIKVKRENAVALRYLAKTFKVRPVLVKVAIFIADDMSVSSLDTYVTDSSIYEDHKVLKLIIEECARKIEIIEASHPMWTVMEPETFLRVISSPLINRNTASKHLSVLVSEYQLLHKYEMDGAMFWKFTTEDILPLVHRKAALVLLETAEEYDNEEDFASLRTRCTRLLALHWKVTCEVERRRLFALLRNLPSTFTVNFLEMVETGRSATLANLLHIKSDDITSRGGKSEEAPRITVLKSLSSGSMTDHLKEQQREWSFGELSLSWRMDPEINFSDFTLEVKSSEDTVHLYQVHKHVLSIGACKSRFFSNLFAANHEGKTSCKKLTIKLSREAARLVPNLLDFMYSPVQELDIDTENAVALRFVATYFRSFLLNEKVVEFIGEDMCLANVATYAKDSKTFKDEKTLCMASLLCARQIKKIDPDSDLLREVDSQFFLRVASSRELDKSAGCHLSILVVRYHALHKLPASMLENLLEKSHMSEIDCNSGLKILQILNELNKSGRSDALNVLRARCMLVLTENWSDFRAQHRDEVFAVLPNLESGLVCNLFDKVEKEYHQQNQEAMSIRNRLVKRYRAQLEEEKRARGEEVAATNAKMEEIVRDMSIKNKALEDQLKRHSEASNRRVGYSHGGTYRSGIPSPSNRASGIPTPIKTSGTSTRGRASGISTKGEAAVSARPEAVITSHITTPVIPRACSGISGGRSLNGVMFPPKQVSVTSPSTQIESASSAAEQEVAPKPSCSSNQESNPSFFDFSGFGYSPRSSTTTLAENAQLASRSFTDAISKSWTFS
jgi:hypothetical protein